MLIIINWFNILIKSRYTQNWAINGGKEMMKIEVELSNELIAKIKNKISCEETIGEYISKLVKEEIYTNLDEFDFSNNTYNNLKRLRINSLRDLRLISDNVLKSYQSKLSKRAKKELNDKLVELGYEAKFRELN